VAAEFDFVVHGASPVPADDVDSEAGIPVAELRLIEPEVFKFHPKDDMCDPPGLNVPVWLTRVEFSVNLLLAPVVEFAREMTADVEYFVGVLPEGKVVTTPIPSPVPVGKGLPLELKLELNGHVHGVELEMLGPVKVTFEEDADMVGSHTVPLPMTTVFVAMEVAELFHQVEFGN
jgi:hypothetical protein